MKKIIMPFLFAFTISTAWSHDVEPTPSQSPVISAQNAPPSLSFRAHRQGRHAVGLMWRFSGNSNVMSVQIQRSYDGEFFNPIFSCPGSNGVLCNWKDENVFPGVIYYRMDVTLLDGTVLHSSVEVVKIVQKFF